MMKKEFPTMSVSQQAEALAVCQVLCKIVEAGCPGDAAALVSF
jgi:hypothetical protein